jgi:hypothetical protein
VISALKSSNDLVCSEALKGLIEIPDSLWLPNPLFRQQLADAIVDCTARDDAVVVSQSWLAIALLGDVLSRFKGRELLWKGIEQAQSWAVEALFEGLQDYNLEAVFDEPADSEGLIGLYGRFGERVDEEILDALSEVGTEEGLRFLARVHYKPNGWNKVSVLKAILRLDGWSDELRGLLAECKNLPDYTREEGRGMLLLSLHKAGKLTMSQLCAEFPVQFSGVYRSSDQDRRLIIHTIETLQEAADPAERRQIARILRASRG